MVCVYICCFLFSLRLGAVLSSIFSLLKVTCIVIILLQKEVEDLMNSVEKFLLYIDFNKFVVELLVQDFNVVFVFITSFFGAYCFASILLGVGALLCNPVLCYPFLVVHILMVLLDVLIYTVLFKYLMLLAFVPVDDQHSYNIGVTEAIFYLTAGIFYVFYDIYLEVCICSFVAIVKNLKEKVIKKSLQPGLPLIIVNRDIHGFVPMFKFHSLPFKKPRF